MSSILKLIFLLLSLFSLLERVSGQRALPRPVECQNVSATEQDVADKYFKKFGNWQRPRLNASDPVPVNITLVLSSINDVVRFPPYLYLVLTLKLIYLIA